MDSDAVIQRGDFVRLQVLFCITCLVISTQFQHVKLDIKIVEGRSKYLMNCILTNDLGQFFSDWVAYAQKGCAKQSKLV